MTDARPKRKRRTTTMREAGPYKVVSMADGTLRVHPEWSGADWPGRPAWMRLTEPERSEGGGPGILSRMRLAEELQDWLNAVPPRTSS